MLCIRLTEAKKEFEWEILVREKSALRPGAAADRTTARPAGPVQKGPNILQP
jgi:hypothetical protein